MRTESNHRTFPDVKVDVVNNDDLLNTIRHRIVTLVQPLLDQLSSSCDIDTPTKRHTVSVSSPVRFINQETMKTSVSLLVGNACVLTLLEHSDGAVICRIQDIKERVSGIGFGPWPHGAWLEPIRQAVMRAVEDVLDTKKK